MVLWGGPGSTFPVCLGRKAAFCEIFFLFFYFLVLYGCSGTTHGTLCLLASLIKDTSPVFLCFVCVLGGEGSLE